MPNVISCTFIQKSTVKNFPGKTSVHESKARRSARIVGDREKFIPTLQGFQHRRLSFTYNTTKREPYIVVGAPGNTAAKRTYGGKDKGTLMTGAHHQGEDELTLCSV